MATKISEPEELVPLLAELLEGSDLPFKYVGRYDESLIPGYPAAQVQPGQFNKELHGSSTWLITMHASIFIMHANMNVSRRTRNEEDLILATRTTQLIERDMTLGGRVIHGFIEAKVPAVVPLGSDKDGGIISTQLLWVGITETRFK